MNTKGSTAAEKVFTAEKHEQNGKRTENNPVHKAEPAEGSSRRHNLIGSNITIAVGSRLRGHKCEIYVNDMRVQLSGNEFCYPDVVVVKGEPKFTGREADILLNPTVIVEILSKKTLYYDKTEKLERYLAMPSVREYLLVKEEEMRVEHYARQNAKIWSYRIYDQSDEMIALESIACKAALSEIYARVKF